MLTIAKFGGSSLADGNRFRAVKGLLASGRRQGIVVSAPGSRFPGDPKVTDLLYRCFSLRQTGGDWQTLFDRAARRFTEIARELGLSRRCARELEDLKEAVAEGSVTQAFLVSRGEYFSALLLAEYLNRPFVDSARWLTFSEDGTVHRAATCGRLWKLGQEDFVTSGFYGAAPDGSVRLLPRGGSDVTGALAAVALEAALYENWTDVPGVLRADPRILPWADPVPALTYEELAELGAMGIQVLHHGAVEPLQKAGIPLHIRSTLQPEAPGTRIERELPAGVRRNRLLCVTALEDRALVRYTGGEDLAALLREHGCTPDYTAAALGCQTACVSAAELLGAPELLHRRPELWVKDGAALLGVLFAPEASEGPTASDLLAALRRAGIPLWGMLRPGGSRTLLLALPRDRCRAALTAVLPKQPDA